MNLEEYKAKLIKLGLSKMDVKEELERYADEVKDQIKRNKDWKITIGAPRVHIGALFFTVSIANNLL